jgi:hypothetical protein
MNSHRNLAGIVVRALCAAALLCVAASAPAQSIYRQMDENGHVTLSDRPIADAEPAAAEAAAGAAPAPPKSALPSRNSAGVNLKEAQRRLEQAQLKRRQGLRPMTGEQTQETGKVALTQRYWRRQEKLRLQVEQAQRRANETARPQVARQ